MHKRGKLDSNHKAVVDALEARGAEVQSLASLGGGVADLLVYPGGGEEYAWQNELMLLEIKDGSKSASRRVLTKEQKAWHKRFPVTVVNSPEEAITAVFWD
jgi:hypothetical protein